MKNLVALILLTTSVLSAQDAITKDIGEFSTLKAYDLINIEMIKSKISPDESYMIKVYDKIHYRNKNSLFKKYRFTY